MQDRIIKLIDQLRNKLDEEEQSQQSEAELTQSIHQLESMFTNLNKYQTRERELIHDVGVAYRAMSDPHYVSGLRAEWATVDTNVNGIRNAIIGMEGGL